MSHSLKLYEITDALAALLDQVDPETGEIAEEAGATLAQFEHKGQAVAAYVLNTEATVDAITATANKMLERALQMQKRAEHLKQYLKVQMQRAGVECIEADDGTFSVKLYRERDTSVEIFDDRQIPPHMLNTPVAPLPKPDKVRIKQALMKGLDVPGARLVKKDRLEIKS